MKPKHVLTGNDLASAAFGIAMALAEMRKKNGRKKSGFLFDRIVEYEYALSKVSRILDYAYPANYGDDEIGDGNETVMLLDGNTVRYLREMARRERRKRKP